MNTNGTSHPLQNRLILALRDASRPRTLGQRVTHLEMHPRTVLYALGAAQSRGLVLKVEGGYALAADAPARQAVGAQLAGDLARLFEVVAACELEWALDLRLRSLK